MEAKQSEASVKVKKFQELMQSEAEIRIIEKFPERILHLNELLEKYQCFEGKLNFELDIPSFGKISSFIHNEEKTPVNMPKKGFIPNLKPTSFVPSNKTIVEVINILKPNILLLLEDTNIIKHWLLLLIPKIEDGNNFGVEVQETILDKIQKAEVSSIMYHGNIHRYYQFRAKAISKVLKRPIVEDNWQSVEDIDSKQYDELFCLLRKIRDCYIILYDNIIKNFDKLKNPRSANEDTMF